MQAAVWRWLSHLQDQYLSHSPNAFYATDSVRDWTGNNGKHQADVVVQPRRKEDGPFNVNTRTRTKLGKQHDWKDACVIGELKQAERGLQEHFKGTLLQLTRYARDAFRAQPTRRFVHGFLLCGSLMELWIFDHSGPYSSGSFNIHEEPDKFIQAIIGYAMMDDEEFGLDTFINRDQADPFITIEKDMTENKKVIKLEQNPFFSQVAVVCRGTNCWRSCDEDIVVKFSWTSARRLPEAEHLKKASKERVEGIAQLVGYQQITSIEDLRQGLSFPRPHLFRNIPGDDKPSGAHSSVSKPSGRPKRSLTEAGSGSQKKPKSSNQSIQPEEEQKEQAGKGSLNALNDSTYDNRIITCLAITPAGQKLAEFESSNCS